MATAVARGKGEDGVSEGRAARRARGVWPAGVGRATRSGRRMVSRVRCLLAGWPGAAGDIGRRPWATGEGVGEMRSWQANAFVASCLPRAPSPPGFIRRFDPSALCPDLALFPHSSHPLHFVHAGQDMAIQD